MWISDIATTAMMIPILEAVLLELESEKRPLDEMTQEEIAKNDKNSR